jgi:hypothetical protein
VAFIHLRPGHRIRILDARLLAAHRVGENT